jgi:hypothetical protein
LDGGKPELLQGFGHSAVGSYGKYIFGFGELPTPLTQETAREGPMLIGSPFCSLIESIV